MHLPWQWGIRLSPKLTWNRNEARRIKTLHRSNSQMSLPTKITQHPEWEVLAILVLTAYSSQKSTENSNIHLKQKGIFKYRYSSLVSQSSVPWMISRYSHTSAPNLSATVCQLLHQMPAFTYLCLSWLLHKVQ